MIKSIAEDRYKSMYHEEVNKSLELNYRYNMLKSENENLKHRLKVLEQINENINR